MRILLVVDLQKEFSDNCKAKYDEIIWMGYKAFKEA